MLILFNIFVESGDFILFNNWRVYFQNVLNPILMKIEFLTSLYRIALELVTEWNLDPDNSHK